MKIKILFEDKNLLVLDKPAGIAVHGDAKNTDKETVVQAAGVPNMVCNSPFSYISIMMSEPPMNSPLK